MILSPARSDEIENAKKEYAKARREAAKQLFDAYKKAINDLEVAGKSDEAKTLRAEMESFVAKDKAALDSMASFDLLASINKLLADVIDANKLGTDLQRNDAKQRAIDQFTKLIKNKLFVIEYTIEEIFASEDKNSYDIKFEGTPTLDALQVPGVQFLAGDKFKLTERQAKQVLPGDRIVIRGQLFAFLNSNLYRVFEDQPGDFIFRFELPNVEGEYRIYLQSIRWQLINQGKQAEAPAAAAPQNGVQSS